MKSWHFSLNRVVNFALSVFWEQVGNHIDVSTGKWTALDSGIGGGIDSYFEYLVKGSIMFDIPELLEHFRGIHIYLPVNQVANILSFLLWYFFSFSSRWITIIEMNINSHLGQNIYSFSTADHIPVSEKLWKGA